MRSLITPLVLSTLLTLAACNRTASPTGTPLAVTLGISAAPDKPEPLFEDDAYRFVSQNYGTGIVKTSGSTLTPGLFVFAKAAQKWMRVERISTAGAKFGYAPPQTNLTRAITWDFRPLAQQETVEIPLKFADSIVNLPNAITWDPARRAYRITFNLEPNNPEVETLRTDLYIPQPDLNTAFAK